MQETPIPLGVRIELCRAALQVMADRVGVRLLHIKGATVDASIRPDAQGGTDVDVIADPGRIDVLHEQLLAHGWTIYSTFVDGSPFGHAQTYWHGDWGFIDLHRRFPGIRLADVEAFNLLWDDRGAFTAAGLAVAVPSVDVQNVLLLLNAARGSDFSRAEATRVWEEHSDDDRTRLRGLATRLGAEVPFAVVAGGLDGYRDRPDYLLWTAVSEGGTRSQEWWGRIRASTSIREAIGIVLRAPRVNRSQLTHDLGRSPTRGDIAAAYARRLRLALTELLPGRTKR